MEEGTLSIAFAGDDRFASNLHIVVRVSSSLGYVMLAVRNFSQAGEGWQVLNLAINNLFDHCSPANAKPCE